MRYVLVSAALAATASAHGLVTRIQGANGVMMPGLSGTSAVHLHTLYIHGKMTNTEI